VVLVCLCRCVGLLRSLLLDWYLGSQKWREILTLLCCITFPIQGKPTQAQDVARRISGAVAREVFAQVKTYQVPITNSSPSHYIICHLPLVFLSPPLHFTFSVLFTLSFPFSYLFRLPFLCARVLVAYLVIMASPLSAPMSPEFEVLHFKQRQGKNLKYAWYRMMEYYRNCTWEVNFRILLRKLYVGLNMSHRQLLDCIAKGIFIEIDPSIAHEIIEGIVGTLPQRGGVTSYPRRDTSFWKDLRSNKNLTKVSWTS